MRIAKTWIVFGIVLGAAPALAEWGPSPAGSPQIGPELPIAVASVFLAEHGGNVDDWKDVQVSGKCTPDDLGHAKPKGDGDNPTPVPVPTPPPPSCDVLYTTNYQVVTCPNGTPRTVASGEGVELKNRHEGKVFHWETASPCAEPLNPALVVHSPLP